MLAATPFPSPHLLCLLLLFFCTLSFASPSASPATTHNHNNIWQQFWDKEHQLHYYYHPTTQETTWELSKDATFVKAEDIDEDEEEEEEEDTDDDAADAGDNDDANMDSFISLEEKNDILYKQAVAAEKNGLLNFELANSLQPHQVEELLENGLLSAETLARLGMQVVERLDEVYVKIKSKLKGSKNSQTCGTKKVPCKTIQQGIDRASQNSKVYVQGGYYAGPGNVNLRIDGRNIQLLSKPKQTAIIDCRGRTPLIDPLHSAGNTGIHDFQIQNCNLQDPNGKWERGGGWSASGSAMGSVDWVGGGWFGCARNRGRLAVILYNDRCCFS